MRKIIVKIEEKEMSITSILISILSISLLRNLIENILKYRRVLNTGDTLNSLKTFFLHYNLFWLVCFLSISLLLFTITKAYGNSLKNCLKVVLFAFPIILTPPIFDCIINNYEFIGYPNNPISVLKNIPGFLNINTYIFGITPGMRYEIFFACLLSSVYIFSKSKKLLTSLIGFVSVFATIMFLGLWISIWGQVYEHGWYFVNSFEISNSKLFSQGFTLRSVTDKITAVYLLALIIFLALSFLFLDKKKFSCITGNFRTTRSIHYILLFLLGVYYAYKKPCSSDLNVTNLFAFDYLAITIGIIAVFFSFQSAVIFNDICDIEIDKISNNRRPLVRNEISWHEYKTLGIVFFLISILAAFCLHETIFTLIIIFHLLAYLYSNPPFRLRNVFLTGNMILAFISLIVFHCGVSLISQDFPSFMVIPNNISISILISLFVIINIKDLKDFEGDKSSNIVSLITAIGNKRGKYVISFLVSLICIGLPVYFKMQSFLLFSILVAAVFNVNLFLKKSKEEIFFIIYYIYSIVFFYFLVNNAY